MALTRFPNDAIAVRLGVLECDQMITLSNQILAWIGPYYLGTAETASICAGAAASLFSPVT